MLKVIAVFLLIIFASGCASLFGWDIHAPGILSAAFLEKINPVHGRIALYLDPHVWNYESKDRGSKTADPQTYHIGEAFAPMIVEAFQQAFDEFIFMEGEPDQNILKRYAIPYLAVVRVEAFENKVTWKGQAVSLTTATVVFDSGMQELGRFRAKGTSEAEKIFAKKGGPQVNLNAAVENNALAIVQHLQDSLRTGLWK